MATQTVRQADIWSHKVAKVVARLKGLNINFLAVDFDQTLISIHTGGCWKGTAVDLVQHVRPMFRHLIAAALESDIHVAVVTFSPQDCMIREVLEEMLGAEAASRIPIRGSRGRWTYNGQGSKLGKQPHMASAVEEIEDQYENDGKTIEITKQSTLLIDDDAKNVRVALSEGVRGVWLNPDKPHRILKDMLRLF